MLLGLFVLVLTPDPPLTIDTRSLAHTVVVEDFWLVGMLKYAFSFPFTVGVTGVVGCADSAVTVIVLVKGIASC
jgi:hypothetical protein